MGILSCLKCGATAEGDTFEAADSLIDHAAPSKKCSGNPAYMSFTGGEARQNLKDAGLSLKKPTAKKSKK